jgi:mono/diheme cytochrome c family protein
LVERNDASIAPALKQLTASGPTEMSRVHALWTLDGMKQCDEATVSAALKDESPRVRAAAIRLCEPFFKSKARAGVLTRLIDMTGERAPFVQQQLALTLGEAADSTADLALAALIKNASDNVFLLDAALSGLAGREFALLERTHRDADTKFISALARCVFASRNSIDIERLLTLISSSPNAVAMLDGILATASTTKRKPVKFKSEPAALKQIKDARLTQISALMTWPDKPGAKTEPPLVPLTTEQQARYELGKVLFGGVCAACHQPHGRGLEGVAPPLVDSEWVLGPEQRLVRILLHGLTGPLSVKGKSYRLDMPALGAFNDEQISGILTYIRREWENTGTPVEPETVKSIRAATADRHEAWIGEQLIKVQ